MLQDLYTVLPAQDLERARGFYHDKLGMEPEGTLDGMLMYRVGPAGRFALYETSNAGTAQNTQMCLISDDLAADMARLRDAGLAFEEYDYPGLKTVGGIATIGTLHAAWFRDSEGNILAISDGPN